MVERIAVGLRLEHEQQAIIESGEPLPPKEELLEEVKQESTMRRWDEVNFCKRVKQMRKAFTT